MIPTVYQTQFFTIDLQEDEDTELYHFQITINCPAGNLLDIPAVKDLVRQQFEIIGLPIMFRKLEHHPLSEVAGWLCEALFEGYGRGVTVSLSKGVDHSEGATVTYGIAASEWDGKLD